MDAMRGFANDDAPDNCSLRARLLAAWDTATELFAPVAAWSIVVMGLSTVFGLWLRYVSWVAGLD